MGLEPEVDKDAIDCSDEFKSHPLWPHLSLFDAELAEFIKAKSEENKFDRQSGGTLTMKTEKGEVVGNTENNSDDKTIEEKDKS